MATKKENIWNHPWVVGVITPLVVLFITDVLLKQNWMGKGWNWLSTFFTKKYPLPLWLIILIGFSSLVLVITISLIQGLLERKPVRSAKPVNNKPEWAQYRQDQFGTDVLYKWNYEFYRSEYDIVDIRLYCPKDNCLLIGNNCPICHQWYVTQLSEKELMVRIIHKIENDLWKNQTQLETKG